MKATITKTVYVESAIRIADKRTGREEYTGHSYRIDLFAEGEVSKEVGWVIDYADIKAFFEPVRRRLDHRCLSDIPELAEDASLQAIENWIKTQLMPWPEWFSGLRVSLPEPDGFILKHLPPDPVFDLPTRLAFTFSAAQSLPQLPKGHPCRELHGHTYQIEIAAHDLQSLAAPTQELFNKLDSTYLNKLPGLEQATAERIAAWVWNHLEAKGLSPTLVAVQETPSNRCHYFGK